MADFPKLPRIKQDDENMEKMHCAARRGQTDLVRRMISSGVDAGIQNKFGCTALHLACKYGQIGATRELATLSDLSGVWHGQRPLHLAVQSGNADIVSLLVETAREQGRDIASFINECDEYEVFEIAGRPKHVQGQTALHWVVASRNQNMIKLLLSLGASPTAKDKNGETPLMRCIEFNLADEFELLMSAGNLRLESGDRQGRSTLHWCILHNRPEMVKRVLDVGHDVNIEDQEKQTPWMLAALAGMTSVLDRVLNVVEPFAIQQASFHNGVNVLPERLEFLPFCSDEAVHHEVAKILQKRLDTINNKGAPAGAAGAKKPMVVAPSAPLKK